MSHAIRRFVMSCFTAFCLALGLAALPAHPALAGQTVIIDTDVADSVYGNGDGPNGADLEGDGILLEPNNNTVIVNGGTVGGSIAGGRGGEDDLEVSGNSVIINGGTVSVDVYGGEGYNEDANVIHNIVTISGSPTLTDAALYGGFFDDGNGDLFTGNTLNVWNYTGSDVNGVFNFQNFNFVLPASLKGLVVGDTAYLNDFNGTIGSTITSVSVIGGAAPVQVGTDVTLITANVLNAGQFDPTQEVTGLHGATLLYDWSLSTTDKQLNATLNSVQANPRAKALSEGFLSGLILLNRGADLVSGQGMDSAVGVGGNGLGVFGALSGGWSRHNTGSHVDMSSVSIMSGLARGVNTTPGQLTLGAFLEFGDGFYDTHNSFSDAAPVAGDGDAYYLGGGVLGRMDFANPGPGRFYTEASARVGGIRNEYNTSGLRDGMGRNARGYDSSSAYYGLHFGTGYAWNIAEKASLDLYGKYFWTRQQGDSVTLATNDPVSFGSANSHRLRLGARFAYAAYECLSPYIGAAYEREFDGKARAATYGYSIDAPSLRGGTGMAEIGLTFKPSRSLLPLLFFDLGVQGYVGKREGVTGSLQIKFDF